MEIAYVDPMTMQRDENAGVKAGTMAVIPSRFKSVQEEEQEPYDDSKGFPLPDHTIICAGQQLSREMYPELSSEYTHTGGFNHFQLPDLRCKFIVGVDEDGEFIMGDGIIYYESVPAPEKVIHDIRQTL